MDYHRSICACSIDSVSTTYNANTVSLIANLSYRPFGIANGMDTGSGGTVANVFDQSGRLTVANPGADKERTYTYDAVGNLTSVDSPSVAWYNRVFGYDVLNRLEHAEGPWGITYNGLGQRVIKTVDGVTTVFHYDFKGNIIAESDENGSFVYEYLYKGGSRLALVDVASGEIFSFLNDRLGTPQMLADSTNTIVWEGIYKPFGEAEVNPNSSVVNNFRFAGQYYDEETGFHYNYHRYYDPHTGRYLRVDPLGLDGGINLYVYAGLNPINLIDSCGLTFDPVDLYDPSKPFSMPRVKYVSVGVSYAGQDYSVRFYDETGWHFPTKIYRGMSTTLLGFGGSIAFEEPNRCESSLDEPIITVGQSKYLGMSTSLDAKFYSFDIGAAAGLPLVTLSKSLSNQEWNKLIDPLILGP